VLHNSKLLRGVANLAACFLLLLVLPSVARARRAKPPKPQATGLLTAEDVVSAELAWPAILLSAQSVIGDLRAAVGSSDVSGDDSYAVKSGDDAAQMLEAWTVNRPARPKGETNRLYNATLAEHALACKYKQQLLSLLHALGPFYCFDNSPPIRFARRPAGTALLVTRLASSDIFNTLRTTQKTRAAKALQSTVLPEIGELRRALAGTSLKYYGLIAFYGARDFSKDYLSPDYEGVALIVSAAAAAKFADGLITEDALVSGADVYVSSGGGSFKKTKLRLE